MEINAASMMAHQNLMNTSAHNVANANTQDYNAKQSTIGNQLKVDTFETKMPTNLSKEMPEQIAVTAGFDAQAKAIHSQDHVLGTLLNMKV